MSDATWVELSRRAFPLQVALSAVVDTLESIPRFVGKKKKR